MPRYRLLVEYDGRPYRGFQAQERLPSIQGAIEKAVLGFSGQKIRLIGAGRTDTGVHATGQVIHMDLEQDWRPAVVRDALNAYLMPQPISILEAEKVADDFHARFFGHRTALSLSHPQPSQPPGHRSGPSLACQAAD